MPLYENGKRDATLLRHFKAGDALPPDVQRLEEQLHGRLVFAGRTKEMAADAAERWNAIYDERPRLVAYCQVPADVRAVLAYARKHELQVTCRSGGHGLANFCLNTGGIVIDLSAIHDVVVDEENRQLTVGAGATWGKVNSVLDEYGLHVPGGGCPEVGVGGYMQGGGYGFTARMFGVNCDNVIRLRMMLHDGRIVVASAERNPDLFWAVRGGTGNNFGVLLSVVYRLVELPRVWAFAVRWPMIEAAETLSFLQREFMRTNDNRKLGWQGILSKHDDDYWLMVRGMVDGSEAEGREWIRPMLEFGHAELEFSGCGRYGTWNGKLLEGIDDIRKDHFAKSAQAPLGFTPSHAESALKMIATSHFIDRQLSPQEWQTIVDYFMTDVSWAMIGMEIGGGAIADAPTDGNAYIHRDVYLDLFCDICWKDDADQPRAFSWRQGFDEMMAPLSNGHAYQNYARRDLADFRYIYWGDVYNSLLFVKRKYDPENFFRFEQTISAYPDDPQIRRASRPSMFSDPQIQN